MYHIALIFGIPKGIWSNGHRETTVVVQMCLKKDFLSPDIAHFLGHYRITKADVRKNKHIWLREINKKFGTSFTHLIVE